MRFLDHKIQFPDPVMASPEGLLAVGGDLSVERLILAYQKGIFPWYENEGPILWWSPDPRFVLFPKELKVSKSMKSFLRKNRYHVTQNTAFEDVITNCAKVKRMDQKGTWITKDMMASYTELFRLGYAKSIEVWDDNQLVGGLYGVDLGNEVFSGESMFTKVSNASKLAFIHLVRNNSYKLIDCQLHTNHLENLGGCYISRAEFLKFITN